MEDRPILEILRSFGPPEWVPEWVLWLTAAGIGVGMLVAFVSLLAMFAIWMERKVAGHIQCRYGPMYAGGWHGWAQSIADGVKLLLKEDIIPIGADRPLFVLAPAIVLASIFGALVVMPVSYGFYFAEMDLGVFTILALGSTTTIGVIMAGWASNSKWAIYGAMREAAQVIAYEIPLGLSLLVPLMALGTFSLLDASAAQAGWYGMNWAVFQNPFVFPAFLIFGVSALAETKRAPFDLPEAESELVAGFLTEYSGIRWSFFFMEEYAAMFLMSVVGSIFFFGGFETPITAGARSLFGGNDHIIVQLVCALTLLLKAFFGLFLMMWLRWTLPRIRIDQVMTMGYKYLTPLSLLCVLGAAIWELIIS
ncbi:MAG: NADH-quinone oxidoreductase subunit H [Chlamydiales bacterium]|jgi:NADH-quinone oxidoreductase subunit H